MQDYLSANALEQAIIRYGHNADALALVAQHHLSSTGKRTRSKLLFSATPFDTHSQALVHAAAAVELIHEASIVHDDIQDQTDRRRGRQTVWRKFGANAALLLGDHLVAAAFRAIAEAPGVDEIKGQLVVVLSESVSRAASGQHLQLTNAAAGDFESFYMKVAQNKTGALIALPLQFAALFNNGPSAKTEPARRCGQQLGLAYQILDDLKPYDTPSSLHEHEDMVHRVITAPVAACQAMFPTVDPFQAMLNRKDLRIKAVRQCQHWLDRALAQARLEAAFLCQQSATVVEHFISHQLAQKPVAPVHAVPSFNRWQQSSSARVEAV